MDGILIYLVIAVAGYFFLSALIRRLLSRRSQSGPEEEALKFQLKVDTVQHEGIDMFRVSFLGGLDFPVSHGKFRFVLRISDVTRSSVGEPVLCILPMLQEENTIYFEYRSIARDIPPAGYFVQVDHGIPIPIPALAFPHSGQRRLKFTVDVTDATSASSRHVFKSTSTQVRYYYSQVGYKQQMELRIKIEEATIRFAVFLAMADGKFDSRERDLILQWCTEVALTYDEDKTDKVTDRLIEVLVNATVGSEDLKTAAMEAARQLRHAPEQEKLAALELSAKVAGADNETTLLENELLNMAAKEMQVDTKRFAAIRDRHLPIDSSTNMISESLLGIRPDMDAQEAKAHLLAEFKKWNKRSSSSNPKIRKKAEIMLKHIAEARTRVGHD